MHAFIHRGAGKWELAKNQVEVLDAAPADLLFADDAEDAAVKLRLQNPATEPDMSYVKKPWSNSVLVFTEPVYTGDSKQRVAELAAKYGSVLTDVWMTEAAAADLGCTIKYHEKHLQHQLTYQPAVVQRRQLAAARRAAKSHMPFYFIRDVADAVWNELNKFIPMPRYKAQDTADTVAMFGNILTLSDIVFKTGQYRQLEKFQILCQRWQLSQARNVEHYGNDGWFVRFMSAECKRRRPPQRPWEPRKQPLPKKYISISIL